MDTLKISLIGGGAAGFFAALRAAEVAQRNKKKVEITIFEASSSFLKKVRISGGGRCNVTHHQFNIREFCANYPRGQKELLSPMQGFQAQDTVEWFKERGVELVAEEDGRMFPTTNTSETIINCFLDEAKKLGVKLNTNHRVNSIKADKAQFKISFKDQEPYIADKVLIATGSSPGGYKIAKDLGHTITELAPSLFSFKIKDDLIKELLGLSFINAKIKLNITGCKSFKEQGPVLITHWGLSGPAVLKLSAWAAREMKKTDYKAQLTINWLGQSRETIESQIKSLKMNQSKSLVKNYRIEELPKRFWLRLMSVSGIPEELKWADLSKKQMAVLIQNICDYTFDIIGKNRFKDEFVECGGVKLSEINFKSMQSKITEGLYFAGELLDVDGITGGFNFQNAWTGAWTAGEHMVMGNEL